MYWKPDPVHAENMKRIRLRAGFTDEQISEIQRAAYGRDATPEAIRLEARISGSPMHLVEARIARLEKERAERISE
jgi:hypothetical protein